MNTVTPAKAAEIMEAVITKGEIANLSAEQRAKYYIRVCESLGLNPMTRPFEYLTLNGKLTLYARKDCTDQLRSLHNISVMELIESERDGVFIVTAKVTNGVRSDVAKGAVHIHGLKGETLANAMMKAETKAKRRATLSICGLGFLDETEVEDMPRTYASAIPASSTDKLNELVAKQLEKPPEQKPEPAKAESAAVPATTTVEEKPYGAGAADQSQLFEASDEKYAAARQAGWNAHQAKRGRKPPGELRDPGRESEAQAWYVGWDSYEQEN